MGDKFILVNMKQKEEEKKVSKHDKEWYQVAKGVLLWTGILFLNVA